MISQLIRNTIIILFSIFFITSCSNKNFFHKDRKYNNKLLNIIEIINQYNIYDITFEKKHFENNPISSKEEFDKNISYIFDKLDKYSYYKKIPSFNFFFLKKSHKITHFMQKDTLHIKIPYIYKGCSDDLKFILTNINHSIKNITIDLTNNPGGLLEESIKIADMFIEKGTLASIIQKKHKKDYFAKQNTTLVKLPISIYVNKNTASSAELLMNILSKYQANVIGSKTYGKTLIQSKIYLDKNNSEYIMLTTGEYKVH